MKMFVQDRGASRADFAGAGTPAAGPTTSDPSTVCLSVAEMQRLIDIEAAAQSVLTAVRTATLRDKNLSDALGVLATVVANPVLDGG